MTAEPPLCIAPAQGALLVPYALNVVSDADRDTFEDHLLRCDACRDEFNQAVAPLQQILAVRATLVGWLKARGHGFEDSVNALRRMPAYRDRDTTSPRPSS